MKKTLVNRQIKAKQVRLIDETGEQLGIVSFQEAAELAIERKLDLIQVTEKIDPPVCRLGDYGKYLYREKKKEKTTQKQRTGDIKGIRLTFNISQHDLETRANQAEKFLKNGSKIKIELPLKGRQKALQDFAQEKIEKFIEILKEKIPIKIERGLKKEPRGFTIIITKEYFQKNENKKIN